MTIVICFLFLISGKKGELDFINFHFVFSISIIFPTFPPLHNYSPHSYPDSSHSHIPIPCIPTLIRHIPTPFSAFPAFPPRFPAFPTKSHTFPPLFPAFPPHSPHSPHSVPRFPIPTFADSRT